MSDDQKVEQPQTTAGIVGFGDSSLERGIQSYAVTAKIDVAQMQPPPEFRVPAPVQPIAPISQAATTEPPASGK